MNILSRLSLRNVRLNRTRSLAAIGGIFLAAVMFTVLTTSVYSLWDYARRGTEYETGNYFVYFDKADETQLRAAREDPEVRQAVDLRITGFFSLYERFSKYSPYPVAAVDADFFEDMSVPLREGRLPENSSEITIPREINRICLQNGWKTWEVGETVTLDLFDTREMQVHEDALAWRDQYSAGETWKREYRIVGITENKTYSQDDNEWAQYCLLTLSDGNEGAALWHRIFLRTAPGNAVSVYSKGYGENAFLNQELLRIYGRGAGIERRLVVFLIIILAALFIISLLSVVLIRSIFSVSVTERTREFGLLASIGTTPKQIRGLVRREALFFLAAALPLGLLAGLLGTAALLSLFRGTLTGQFTFGENVVLSVRPSPAALLVSALICTITVLLSVASPARRASRIIPLEAIRQSEDVRIRKKKSNGHASHLLGVPGWVGVQYERTIRKKSRAVTAALALSLILFLPSAYLAGMARKEADVFSAGFDFELNSAGGEIDPAVVEKLRGEPEVYSSVLYFKDSYFALFPTADLPEDYKTNEEVIHPGWNDYSSAYSAEQIQILYVEDRVLSETLQAEGIDPAPLLQGEDFSGVSVPFWSGGIMIPDGNGGWRKVFYEGYGPDKMPEELLCITLAIPAELSGGLDTYRATDDGQFLLGDSVPGSSGKTWLLVFDAEENGGTALCTYYDYDMSTGQTGGSVSQAEIPYVRIRPAAQLHAAPSGFDNLSCITFILPLSKLADKKYVSFGIKIRSLSDYYSLSAKLKALIRDDPLLVYTDHREAAVNSLGLAALIRGIATGFLILVSLFSAINIFYTTSTNLLLRRRDFGILRSIGFTRRDLFKMVTAESARSSLRALLFGIPAGIALSYVLHLLNRNSPSSYRLPWGALLFGIGLVLLLMLASILYSMHFLKKQTPLEAIRQSEG